MRVAGFLAVLAVFFATGTAFAAKLSVELHLSGTEYKGAPSFELRADGKVVGKGTLDSPVPADQVFSFTLASGNPKKLSIVFVNDTFQKGKGDRNLYILSVKVGSTVYDGSALATPEGPGARVVETALRLFRKREAVLARPSAGW